MRLGEFRTRSKDLNNKLIIKVADYNDDGIIVCDVDWDMSNDKELYLRVIDEKLVKRWDELLPNDKKVRFRFVSGSYQLDNADSDDILYPVTRIYDNLEQRFLSHDMHDIDYILGMLNKLWNLYLNAKNGREVMMSGDGTCKGCKWLENKGTWCDMRCGGVSLDHPMCKDYDSSKRYFDPKVFYNQCQRYVEMYESFCKKSSSFRDELFDGSKVEFLGFALNDIKREIQYYERYRLSEDLNRVDLPITQRK